MSEKTKFIWASGSMPTSLFFSDLLEESDEVTSTTKNNLMSLEDILKFGGSNTNITIEHVGKTSELANPIAQIFEVLALDLATIFPAIPGKDTSRDPLIGRQICFCKSNGDFGASNWYSSALKEYFKKGTGGSLLTLSDVPKQRWWLLRLEGFSEAPVTKNLGEEDTTKQNLFWKTKFNPYPKKATQWENRFDEYGKTVFKHLQRTEPANVVNSSIIIWVYIGPSERTVEEISGLIPSWRLSLFIVLRPLQFDQTTYGHWLNDPQLRRHLSRAIERIHFYLQSSAYSELEFHRLLGEAQMKASQAVAHEFKNLTQDISSLASLLYEEFINSIYSIIRRFPELNVFINEQLSAPLSRLNILSKLGRLTSAVALATYWLTTRDMRRKISFVPDKDCKILCAAVFFAIAMYELVRKDWLVDDLEASFKESCQILCNAYQKKNESELVEDLGFALLLFVVSEPVRNLRSSDNFRQEVSIRIEVRGKSLFICQKTCELTDPTQKEREERSIAAMRINQLLQSDPTIPENFVVLHEIINVVRSTKHPDGYFEVERETQIDVVGVPLERR